MTQKDNNTITAYHFKVRVDGEKIVKKDKIYKWHIPKRLRWTNIQVGDIVEVFARGKKIKVIVANAFREDVEDTGVSHAPVVYVSKPIGRYLDRKRKRVNYYGKN